MKNILREDFVKKIHKKVYKEDIVKTLLIKDPIISINLKGNELSLDDIENLTFKINFALSEMFNDDFDSLEVINMLQEKENNGITKDWKDNTILYLDYNTIYEKLVDLNKISSKEMIVYRVEGQSGKGIYMDRSHADDSINDKFDNNSNTNPSPMEDGALASLFGAALYISRKTNSEWNFGFRNKRDLEAWFTSEKGMLDFIVDAGAKVVEYKISSDNVIAGEKQVAFKIKKAVKKNEINLKDFIEQLNKPKINKNTQLNFNF